MSMLACLIVLAFAATANAAAVTSTYRPVRLDYRDIQQQDNLSSTVLMEMLQTVGMVSITNMPKDFHDVKHAVQRSLPDCMGTNEFFPTHVFDDGTQRTTLAAHTIAGGQVQPLQLPYLPQEDISTIKACQKFEQASVLFRQYVDQVTRTLAKRVGEACDLQENEASALSLQTTKEDIILDTFFKVVEHGEHLEHFHKYYKASSSPSSTTIEWHTDQGLFLVFAPGLLVSEKSMQVSVGFYIELPDGSRPMVQLDSEMDDLVLLLGDGLHQIMSSSSDSLPYCNLRAGVPHALTMPKDNTATRVWYGRMVLPPAQAIHPQHGLEFGILRQQMIDNNGKKEIMALGCSGHDSLARQLDETSCEEGTLMCWHQCMSLKEQGLESADTCVQQGLDLRCINPRNQLWDNTHGDWFPGCIDASTAELGTPYPSLPDFPLDNTTCTDELYNSYVEETARIYDHVFNLTNGGTLFWSVDEENGVVDGKLSYLGLFGFLSLGFAGPPEESNAMTNALIIMAKPSMVYNASHGFDGLDDGTATSVVDEHAIGPDKAFRHWQTPLSAVSRADSVVSDPSSYSVEEDVEGCFTTLSFRTMGIFDRAFNVTGADRMIWAANGVDSFAGYHGQSRGVMTVEWISGVVTLKEHTEQEDAEHEDVEHNDADHEDAEHSDADHSDSPESTGFALSAVSLVGMAFSLGGAVMAAY